MVKRLVWLSIALGIVLRIALLNQPIWYDEAFTLMLAKLPLTQMIAATAGDVHPPLFYLTVWASVRLFGTAFWALRLPGLLFSLMGLATFAYIVPALKLPRAVEALSIIAVALSPMLIYHAAEARMYNLFVLFVLAGAWAVWRGNWGALGVALGLGMLTHNMFVLYVVTLSVWWLARWDVAYLAGASAGETAEQAENRATGAAVSAVLRLLGAAAIAGTIYAPWVGVVWRQIASVGADYWIMDLSAGRIIAVIYESLASPAADETTLILAVVIVFVLLLVGAGYALKQRRFSLLWLAFAPLLIGLIISVAFRPILIYRIMIGATPFMLVVMSLGLWEIKRVFGWGMLVPFVGALFLIIGSMFTSELKPKYAERYQATPIMPGANCYHISETTLILAEVYMSNCHNYLLPETYTHSVSDAAKRAMGMDMRPFEAMPPTFETWLVFNRSPYSVAGMQDAATRILTANPDYEAFEFYNDSDIQIGTMYRFVDYGHLIR